MTMIGEPGTRGEGPYESAFAVAMTTDAFAVASARRISHDTVIANSGRSRRSGVRWTEYPTATAIASLADYGIDAMPEVVDLCSRFPSGVLVMATVEVDESVAP